MIARQIFDNPIARVLVMSLFLQAEPTITKALAQTTIPLADLPAPPAELKRLIEAGRVTFEYCVSDEETASRDAVSDKKAVTNGQPDKRLSAETHYRIRFDYDAKFTWRVVESQRELRISSQLRRFVWQPSHTVWFRDRPKTEDFWSNPLVLHEFDHVRLSTDPRLKARFEKVLQKPVVIGRRLAEGEQANDQLARRLTDDYLQRLHREVIELIGIRYQELDRATSQGRDALGQDSRLYDLLREDRS